MRNVVSSLLAIALLTAVFGFAYPALMTGVGQVAFSHQANGSLVKRNGRIVGSELAAQAFTGPRYFHERPSATSPPYNAGGTTFANLGPTSSGLAANVKADARAVVTRERAYNPGLTIHQIPVDAVTTSGSGIDPDISPAYAALQSRRIAAVRHVPLATVQKLIRQNTVGRSWRFFGEPGVNVLRVNLELDDLGGS
jgi:K+-transporting ATPase ATPase C chain